MLFALSLIALGLGAATSSATAIVHNDTPAATGTSSSITTPTSTAFPQSVIATFPQFGPEQNITGTLTFTPAKGGVGVVITSTGDTALQNFPAGSGPFLYHVHVDPIPANGSCLAAGGHLDPLNEGESPPCNPQEPQICQYGDLSGKYGDIKSDPFDLDVVDVFLSFDPTNAGFFLGRSVVIHSNNGTRIACANLQVPADDASVSVGSNTTVVTSSTSASGTTTGSTSLSSSAASGTASESGSLSSATPSSEGVINSARGVWGIVLAMAVGVWIQ